MNIVVATCKNRGIGINNKLPWRISSDMNFFKYLTIGNKNNAVVMGKNTFESLPKPLKNRDNIVVSTTIKKNPNLIIHDNFNCVKNNISMYDDVYLIGGEQVYNNMIIDNYVAGIYHTRIKEEYDCDTFFPEIPKKYEKINTIKFKDKDKLTNQEIFFDIDLFINEQFIGDNHLNYYRLNDNLMKALNKLNLNHNIINYLN